VAAEQPALVEAAPPAEQVEPTAVEASAAAVAPAPIPATDDSSAPAQHEVSFTFAEAVDVPTRRWMVILFAGMIVAAAAVLVLSLRPGITRSLTPASPELAGLLRRVNSGDVHAQFELAQFYARGGDAEAAMQWLSRAAGEGEPAAQYELARHYLAGNGVARNEGQAIDWLLKAAHQGNSAAQYELGQAYEQGIGVPLDPVKAYACYVMAAANGSAESEAAQRSLAAKLTQPQIAEGRALLGEMYAGGVGTPVDNVQAYVWFRLAEVAGSPEARRRRAEVASKMSEAEIEAATQRAYDMLNGPEQ
jgi:TPR repeat protein